MLCKLQATSLVQQRRHLHAEVQTSPFRVSRPHDTAMINSLQARVLLPAELLSCLRPVGTQPPGDCTAVRQQYLPNVTSGLPAGRYELFSHFGLLYLLLFLSDISRLLLL